jgi:hypothetical protein
MDEHADSLRKRNMTAFCEYGNELPDSVKFKW